MPAELGEWACPRSLAELSGGSRKSEQEKGLELSGGVVHLWSLDGADAGHGRKYALIVIDEAAMHKLRRRCGRRT